MNDFEGKGTKTTNYNADKTILRTATKVNLQKSITNFFFSHNFY